MLFRCGAPSASGPVVTARDGVFITNPISRRETSALAGRRASSGCDGGYLHGVASLFRVARNPDEGSTLPYVIELPLPSGPLRLKAKDTWPRTAKVYCHRATDWPADAEIVEEIAVRSCVRRGVAIDLVLDRRRENRSQFVVHRR